MASGGDSHNLWGNSPDDLWKKVLDEVSSESRRRKSSSSGSSDRGVGEDSVKDLELLTKILKVVKAEKDATVAALDKIYESVGSSAGQIDAASSIDPEVLDEIKRAIISLAKQNQPDKHGDQLKRLADHIEVISKRVDEQAEQVKQAQLIAKSEPSQPGEPPLDPDTITQPLIEAIGNLESRLESLAAQQAAQAEKDEQARQDARAAQDAQGEAHAETHDNDAAEQLANESREAMAGISSQLNELQQRVEQFAATASAASAAAASTQAAAPDASASVNNELLFQILDQTKALSEQSQVSDQGDAGLPDFAGIEAKLDSLIASLTHANDLANDAGSQTSSKLDAIQGQLSDLAAKQTESQQDESLTEESAPAASQESVDSLRQAVDAQREQSETGFASLLDHLTKPPTQAPTAKIDEQQFNELREAVRTKPSTDDQLLTEMLGTVAQTQASQQETLASINERMEQVGEAVRDATAAREDNGSRDLLQQIHDAVQAMLAKNAEDTAAEQTGDANDNVAAGASGASGVAAEAKEEAAAAKAQAEAQAEAITAQFASLRQLIAKQGEGTDQSSLLYEVLESVRSLTQKQDASDVAPDTAKDAATDAANAEMLARLDAIEQRIIESSAAAAASTEDTKPNADADGAVDVAEMKAAAAEQKEMLEQILEAITAPVEKDDTAATAAAAANAATVTAAESAAESANVAAAEVGKVAAKLDGIESKIESLSQQQPADANILNEILNAVQASAKSGAETNVDPDTAAEQKAMLERIEQSLQSFGEANSSRTEADVAAHDAVLQNILDAVQTTRDGPVTKDLLDSMQGELAARTDLMAKEVRESLGAIAAKNESYDTMLLEILAGVNEATEAGRATDQKVLLQEIADAVKSQPGHDAEQSERVLAELRALVDTSKLNQKTFERVLDALETNTKAIAATTSISASSAQSNRDDAQQYSYTAWSDRKQKDRSPMLVVVAVAAVLIIVVGLTIYNTVILNRTKDSFNQAGANLGQNNGQNDAKNNGNKDGQPAGKDQLAQKDLATKDSTPAKNVPAAKDSVAKQDDTKLVSKDDSVTKDGEATATKDGNVVATKDGKKPFNPFKVNDGKGGQVGKDGKTSPTPVVPKTIIEAIAKETQNNSNTKSTGSSDDLKPIKLADAKQIVFLVHVSGNSDKVMPVLLRELNRTIGQLDEKQLFTVVFSEGQRAIEVPPAGLKEGTNRNKEWVAGWMDVTAGETGVRPASSPYIALGAAMAYKPDLLWVFSDGLAGDQPGQVKPDALLAKLKTLNADRKTHVNATQCVAKDDANTLKNVADQHGGTFNFVDAEEAASAGS